MAENSSARLQPRLKSDYIVLDFFFLALFSLGTLKIAHIVVVVLHAANHLLIKELFEVEHHANTLMTTASALP